MRLFFKLIGNDWAILKRIHINEGNDESIN